MEQQAAEGCQATEFWIFAEDQDAVDEFFG
jgi:hypothetical protein